MHTVFASSEKDKEISEDDMKKLEKQVQDLTDLTIKTIDDVLAKKENECFPLQDSLVFLFFHLFIFAV